MYKILIVDDEQIERNGIRFLLKRMKLECETEEAVNGTDALLKLKTGQFDILLTDVKMPFMDGIELIEQAAKENIKIRSVIFSGCNEFDYARRAIRLGVVDYILKPVDPAEFETTILKVTDELEEAKAAEELKSRSMEFLQEDALYRLIYGTPFSQVKEEFPELALDFSAYASILLLEFDHDFFGRRGVDFKKNEHLAALPIAQFLNLNEQQELLFLSDAKRAADMAHEIVRIVQADYGAECTIAVSSPLHTPDDMAEKMEELDALLENRFYHPELRVFYPHMESETQGIIRFDDDTSMKQMKQDIKMRDIGALREHFAKFCETYRHGSEYSQIYIKFLFSNLLKDIYGSIDGIDETELNRDIEKLYLVNDFHQLMELVQVAIDRLESCFAGKTQTAHREVELVKQYIYKNYGKELGIDLLAERVYLTPSYLSTIFKKETGQNLSKFIKAYRMERAKDMLEDSTAKIVDISIACGYPNVSYFCSSFREFYGLSPQKFRENGGNAHA